MLSGAVADRLGRPLQGRPRPAHVRRPSLRARRARRYRGNGRRAAAQLGRAARDAQRRRAARAAARGRGDIGRARAAARPRRDRVGRHHARLLRLGDEQLWRAALFKCVHAARAAAGREGGRGRRRGRGGGFRERCDRGRHARRAADARRVLRLRLQAAGQPRPAPPRPDGVRARLLGHLRARAACQALAAQGQGADALAGAVHLG
mmetsp:Transcript_8916/g.28034  ORF Transcript_8916/g.28034 Transcript_8916/m.28034 type:complete len:206 (+) Transcript_8916:525-1142(+)